jgi:maltose O-acetyltransferase
MRKRRSEPRVEELLQKDVFDRIADGDWYQYSREPKVQAIVKHSAQVVQRINDMAKNDTDKANQLVHDFLPNIDASVEIYYPICSIEHPGNLYIGKDTFINANLQILSAGKVTIGKNCFIGPNCQLYTPNHHPSNVKLRREGWQYDLPITVGDDCWFGGSVIVLPGVTLGDNVVVGAGSVVTQDLPSNVVAVGNPARIVKHTTV